MDRPGIHDGIPPEKYHAIRALSGSGCKVLIDECPAIFWHEFMNPAAEEDEDTGKFDIGTAAHLLYLEPEAFEARSAIIEADSLEQAIQLVSEVPCAVANGVVEVWPLDEPSSR